jgi:hypothetical protein
MLRGGPPFFRKVNFREAAPGRHTSARSLGCTTVAGWCRLEVRDRETPAGRLTMQHTTKGAVTAAFGAVSETVHRGLDYTGAVLASGPHWLASPIEVATEATNYLAAFFFCWSALLLAAAIFAALSRVCRLLCDGIDWMVVHLVQATRRSIAFVMRRLATGLRHGATRLEGKRKASSTPEHQRSSPPLRTTSVS